MVSTFSLDDYVVKEDHGAKWLRIFYHNSQNSEFFSDNREAAFSINNANKYSILKYLPHIRTYERGKYEFLIEYPGSSGFNRWKQTSNPLTHTTVTGFEYKESDLTWPIYFDGLSKYTNNLTFLAGCYKKDWWHFAIGSYTQYKTNVGQFPGQTISTEGGALASQVILWIRVAKFLNMFDFGRVTCKINTKKNDLLFMIFVCFTNS